MRYFLTLWLFSHSHNESSVSTRFLCMCVVVVVVFYTCGGTSSRSRWLFLPGASSTLCWDTVLPPRCHHPHLPLALSSGSLHWRGQGSPVTSTKKTAQKPPGAGLAGHFRMLVRVWEWILFLSLTHTHTHTRMHGLTKLKRAARFTNIRAFAWVQAKRVCQASSGSYC